MNGKAVITLIAASNATKIESKADSENFFKDFFYFVGDLGKSAYNDIPDTGVLVWDYFSKADGLTDDINYLKKKTDSGFGSGLEFLSDSWEWMTDDQGQNWVALGENMLDVSVDLLTLDLEGA